MLIRLSGHQTSDWAAGDPALQIFSAAARLRGVERSRFLDERCGRDAELRREVEEMLSHHDAPPKVLTEGVLPTASLPDSLGPYRILEVLGRGGMGIVYRAEQSTPRRCVALKVLQPGFVHGDRLRRFVRESEVLGSLQHPGIASLFDAGAVDTDFGAMPFIAMELVDGVAIDRFADIRKLDDRERCALVIQVCKAIHHAHEHGVVHRDLKPGNILVAESDNEPLAKVLDFGIARCSDLGSDDATALTMTGQLVGTLPYMSPEQLDSKDAELDARTDVYALGVILFQLLGRQLPLSVLDQPVTEAVRIIREVDPPTLRSLRAEMSRDLETITARALAKAPDERYPNARALAADLENFLESRPINARPASRFYRARKFVSRNRVFVLGVTATIGALLIGLIGMALLARSNSRLAEREVQARLEMRATLYSTQMDGAADLLHAAEGTRGLRDLVGNWPEPATGEPELRGWEFDLVRAAAAAEVSTHSFGSAVDCLTWLRDRSVGVWSGFQVALIDPLRTDGAGRRIVRPQTGRVAFDRSGRRIASVRRRTIQIARDDAPDDVIVIGGLGDITRVWWSHDGRFVCALWPRVGKIQVVEIASRTIVATLGGGERSLAPTCSFSPDGKWVAVGRWGSPRVELVRTSDWQVERRLESSLPPFAVAFSPDGRWLAGGLSDSICEVWDLSSARSPRRTLGHRGGFKISDVAWAPDSKSLAVAQGNGAAMIHWLDGAPSLWLRGAERRLESITFSRDGRYVVAGGEGGVVRCWDVQAQPPTRLVTMPIKGGGPYVRWSADGSTILAGRAGYGSWRVAPRSGRILDPFEHSRYYNHDMTLWFSRGDEVVVRATESNDVKARISGLPENRELAWSPVDDRLAVRAEGELRIYRPGSGEPATPAVKVAIGGGGLEWSDDGAFLARSLFSNPHDPIEIHDGRTGVVLRRFAVADAIQGLSWSPDARHIAVGSGATGTIHIVEWRTGRIVSRLQAPQGVQDLDWHPDGRRIAASGGGVLRIWDVERQASVFAIRDWRGAIEWSPDGRTLAGVTLEGPLWIWHAPSFGGRSAGK